MTAKPPSIESEPVYRDEASPWLTVYSDLVTPPEGTRYQTKHVELMDGHAGAVCIVRFGSCLLMGCLWRPAIQALSLEFPRGMGEPGEGGVQTARRELEEEAGVAWVESAREVGVIYADTGLLSNPIWVVEVVAARDRLAVGPELLGAEWIEEVDVAAAVAAGRISDGITIAAWALWKARTNVE